MFAQAGAALLSAGLLFSGASLRAQQPAEPAAPCRPEIERVDTLIDTLFAWLPGRLRGEREELFRFRSGQERTALGMVNPIPLLGRRYGNAGWQAQPPPGADHLMDAEALVWFQLRDDGRLVGMKLERRSGWSALDVALQRALIRGDSLRSFEPLPAPLAGTPIDLWLAAGFHRMRGATNVPIARMARTEERFRGPVVEPRLLGFDRGRYPDAAARSGVEDRVMLEFVIDTTGRVVPESIRPIQGTYREFVLEAVRVLRGARFAPARVGRCAAAKQVTMPVNFMLLN